MPPDDQMVPIAYRTKMMFFDAQMMSYFTSDAQMIINFSGQAFHSS